MTRTQNKIYAEILALELSTQFLSPSILRAMYGTDKDRVQYNSYWNSALEKLQVLVKEYEECDPTGLKEELTKLKNKYESLRVTKG